MVDLKMYILKHNLKEKISAVTFFCYRMLSFAITMKNVKVNLYAYICVYSQKARQSKIIHLCTWINVDFQTLRLNKNQAVLTHCALKQIFYIILFQESERKKPTVLVTCQLNWVGGAVQNKINDIVNYEIRMETKFNLYQNVHCYIDCVEILHVKNIWFCSKYQGFLKIMSSIDIVSVK